MGKGLSVVLTMVSGLVTGLIFLQAYSLVSYIRKMDEETACDSCERKSTCRALRPIGSSNWVTEFTYTTWRLVRRTCDYAGEKKRVWGLVPALLNGVLYVGLYLRYGFGADFILSALCTTTLLYIGIVDWNTQYIPVEFNIIIFILGLVRLGLQPEGWAGQVIGLCSVSVVLLLVDWIGSRLLKRGHVVGGGDIKLMAAAGLFIGWKLNIVAFMMGCICGSIIHLIIMKIGKGTRQLAFGPYLAMGVYIAMICGEQLVSWYLGIMGL